MKTRVITGVVVAVLLLAMCYFSDTPTYFIAVGILSAIGVWEMAKCVGLEKKLFLSVPSVMLSISASFLAGFCGNVSEFAVYFLSVIFVYLLFIMAVAVFSKGKIPIDEVFTMFTSIVYVVLAFASLILLRDRESGQYLILIAIFMPLISDVFAYFCGFLFGKHKLIPDVSPKKTVEGSVGGMFFCGVACAVFGVVVAIINGGAFEIFLALRMFFIGVIVSVISQIGDLIASVIKRRYGIKDYGKLFPGHGGVLDRFDSVLATSPIILIMTMFPSFVSIVQ